MNVPQRLSLSAGLVLAAAVSLYPPWLCTATEVTLPYPNMPGPRVSYAYAAGHHAAFSPPAAELQTAGPGVPERIRAYRVDVFRLLSLWAAALALGAAGWVVAGAFTAPSGR